MKDNENNKRQADNRRRNIADQNSPIIDLTKQTEKESKEENAHPKYYQSLGSNQKKSYAEAIKRGNQRANLQTASPTWYRVYKASKKQKVCQNPKQERMEKGKKEERGRRKQ